MEQIFQFFSFVFHIFFFVFPAMFLQKLFSNWLSLLRLSKIRKFCFSFRSFHHTAQKKTTHIFLD